MDRRVLGNTGLQVGALSLGGAFVTRGDNGWEGANRIVKCALDMGINLIDTSADYGDSEAALGGALASLNQPPCYISTKLGPRSGSHLDAKDPEQLQKLLDESLNFLGRSCIDIFMIHEPERPKELDWFDNFDEYTGPVMELMQEWKRSGKIRYTGIGGTTVYEMTRIIEHCDFDVVLTAFNSSPLWRDAVDTVIPAATKKGMGIMIGSPTQQGWLATRYDTEVNHGAPWLSPPRRHQLQVLYEFIDEIDIPLPELCIRWAIGLDHVSTVLTGPRNTEQLKQNFRAAEAGKLPPEIAQRLDEIWQLCPYRPFEEPAGCKFHTDYRGPGNINY